MNSMERHYGIEIIGYGKRRRYAVKRILENGTAPVGYGKTYKTEAEARAAARCYGVEVEAVGDLWELMGLNKS